MIDGVAAPEHGGAHWNPRVHPEFEVISELELDVARSQELRRLGFAAAHVVPDDGIFRGVSALVCLSDGPRNRRLVRDRVAQHVAFQRGQGRDAYPNSLMGVIALVRQTLIDAAWQRDARVAYDKAPGDLERPEHNAALTALEPAIGRRQPVCFAVRSDLDALRALRLAKEFDLDVWLRGSGYEYRRLDDLAGTRLIVPVTFPDAPQVQSLEDAARVSLRALHAWDRAPTNPARLAKAGIPFSLTSAAPKDRSKFFARMRRAIERGLPVDAALRALTLASAELFGVADRLGSIATGKIANLVLTDGDLFAKGTHIVETWVDGKPYEVDGRPPVDPRGAWQATLENGAPFVLTIAGELSTLRASLHRVAPEQPKGERPKGEKPAPKTSKPVEARAVKLDVRRLGVVLPGSFVGHQGSVRLSAAIDGDTMHGSGEWPDGVRFGWSATRAKRPEPKARPTLVVGALSKDAIERPEGAFGRTSPPKEPATVVVRDATIWTSAEAGKIDHGTLLVQNGRITAVGDKVTVPEGALVIDAKGKHVTAGLIDAHSHTAISGGVNEGTQAVTAEVRIQDVINPDDMNLYRQLAGGLTSANLLHGSANPIGGQMQVIKLRWGADLGGLVFDGAAPGIKFALGENVKQSNWGDGFNTRYPQSRMGVEQILRDRFQAAREYVQDWQSWNEGKTQGRLPPRRDLELEALAEILAGKRMVHCHSYRQDEILMLMRVAEDFGFRIGTLQHILEGYKVAEVIKKHGAMASTFSDWWAYKYEVIDAIPYNGALMHKLGIVTSFNSDSAELARRMNLEAAKAVKYGGVSESEALRFVTLNPAKQLHVDKRVGSLEVGKDADFVIWSGHPLSTYTVCEQTWIDGRKYFDRADDAQERQAVVAERARLIQKILAERRKRAAAKRKSAGEKVGQQHGEGGR